MTGTLESFHVPDAMGWDLQIGNKTRRLNTTSSGLPTGTEVATDYADYADTLK